MRKSVLVLGALFLSCAPADAACPNQACRAVAERCGAADRAYGKQIHDAMQTIKRSGSDEDTVGPIQGGAIAAADALVQLWESGDCAVMMQWGKVSGQAQQVVDERSEAAGLRTMRGNAYVRMGDLDSANADFNQAIALNPNNSKKAEAYNGRGNVYRNKGEFDRAIADFNQAIAFDPKLKYAYVSRGLAHQLKNDENLAIADFSRAIDLDPTSAAAYLYRGFANLYAGTLPKAAADLNQASALDPKNAFTALWLDIVNKRSDLPSRLQQAISQLDMTKWPAPVIRLFLGEMTLDAVMAAAENTNPTKKKGQVCDVDFYSGQLALQRNAKDEAARLFRLAASDCSKSSFELFAANAELKALGFAQLP